MLNLQRLSMPIASEGGQERALGVAQPIQCLVGVALIFTAAIIYQFTLPTGSDVSWLITVCEKILAGERFNIDVIELNPPMAAFLYMPAVLLEHATGASAETIEILLTAAVALGSLWLSAVILMRAGLGAEVERFLILGAFVTMILPRLTYSEREHFALLLLLPIFVLTAARAIGVRIPLGIVIAVGISAGLGATIKPYFILAILLPVLYRVIVARSLRPALEVENWIAAAIVIAFTALLVLLFPSYLSDVVPMVAETYLQARLPLVVMLTDPLFLSVAGVTALSFALRRRGRTDQLTVTLLLAAIGFAIGYVEQGKGWRYQFYPALAIVFLVAATEVLPRVGTLGSTARTRMGRSVAQLAGFAAILGLLPFILLHNNSYTISLGLTAKIRALGPHPRLFALSHDIGVGHPLTRAVNGIWVSRTCSQFVTFAAGYRRDQASTDETTRARMEGWIAWDRDRVAEAIRDGKPDAIVYDPATFDLTSLLAARPDIADLLRSYRKTAEANGVELLVRADLIGLTAAVDRIAAK